MAKFIKVTVSDQEFSSWKQLADTEGRSLANFVYQAMRDRIAGVAVMPVAAAPTPVEYELTDNYEDDEPMEVPEMSDDEYIARKKRVVEMMQFLGNLAKDGATEEELTAQRDGFAGLELEFDSHVEKLVAHYFPKKAEKLTAAQKKNAEALESHKRHLDGVLDNLMKHGHSRSWIEGIMNEHKRDKDGEDGKGGKGGKDGAIYTKNAAALDKYVEELLAQIPA